MQVCLQIRDHALWLQICRCSGQVSLGQGQSQWNLAGYYQVARSIVLAFMAAGIFQIPKHVERADFVCC